MLIGALIHYNGNYTIFQTCCSYFTSCIPLACGAVYMVLENKICDIIFKFKYVILFMMPYLWGAIFYFCNTDKQVSLEGFGGIVYLSIGYAAVTMYSFLLCDIFMQNTENNRYISYITLVSVEILTVSLVIILSGSRGVVLSWMFTNLASLFIAKNKKRKLPVLFIAGSFLVAVIFLAFAPSDNASRYRLLSFVDELKEGSLQLSVNSEESRQLLNMMYDQADFNITKDILEKIELDKQQNQTNLVDDPANLEFSQNQKFEDTVKSVTNGSMARSYLWQLGIIEIKNHPFAGMGVMGYQMKYGTYTHNILLGMAVDFGIPLFVCFLIICIYLILFYFKAGVKSLSWACMIIYLCGQMVKNMLSGDVYVSEMLIFSFTLMLAGWRQFKGRFIR